MAPVAGASAFRPAGDDNLEDGIMSKDITFLLAEDDDIHAHLVVRSLERSPLKAQVYRVTSGLQALGFLHRKGEYSSAPRPDVVLLDLKLPIVDGHEVLAAIKCDESLRMIPVIIMTTSRDDGDLVKAYRHYANSYIVKPADYQRFREVVMDISHYWGERNEPPCFAST